MAATAETDTAQPAAVPIRGDKPSIVPRLVAYGLFAVVGYLVIPPLLVLVYGSLTNTPPGVAPVFTLDTLMQAYGNSRVLLPLGRSVAFSVITATSALIIGAFLAWLVERTQARLRSFTDFFTLVPLLLPAVLLASGWILLLSPRIGTINVLYQWVFGAGAGNIDIFTFAGMAWVCMLQELPLAFMWLWPAFRAMNPELEEAAIVSGAGTLTTLRKVTLPLLWPTLAAAWVIFFIVSMGALAVPLLIGMPAGIFLYSTEIYLATARIPTNLNLASAYGLLFLLIAALGVYANGVVAADSRRYSTITGRGYRARRMALSWWQNSLVVTFAVLLLMAAAVLPLLILFWNAFMPYPQPPSMEGLARATLDNFPRAWNYGPAKRAVINSICLGVGAGVITTLIGAMVAWGTVRQPANRRLFGVLDFLCTVPLAIPGIIIGVSFVWLYLLLPVPVYGTVWILLLAYITLHLPYAVRICSSAIGQIHPELEEAASVSGAGYFTNLASIVAPLVAPGIAVSVVFITIRAFREYQASIFLTASGSEVFSIIVLDMADGGNSTILAAYATVVVLFLGLAAMGLYWIGRRTGVKM